MAAQMTFGEGSITTELYYLDCSTLRAEPMPNNKTDLLMGKSKIVKHLKDSFDYCVTIFDKLDDQKILSSQQMTASFLHPVVHNH